MKFNLNVQKTPPVPQEKPQTTVQQPPQEITPEYAEQKLISDLELLNNPKAYERLNIALFSELERTLGNNRTYYSSPALQSQVAKKAIGQIQGVSQDYKHMIDIIKRYVYSPFGIFDNILKLPVSDLFVVSRGISFTQNNFQKATFIQIPDRLLRIYSTMVDTFITLTLYASASDTTKFDKTNAILDYAVFGIRFNVAHSSLNASLPIGEDIFRPTIALRKQIMGTRLMQTMGDEYIHSIGANENQIKFIQYLAEKGSYTIFGETGSGKTTLLKYMGSYKIEDKRNLITIEDTPELFLPVNIAYLTNDRYTISDLFKVALRQNPSSIIIGESRTAEVSDIMEAALVFQTATTFHSDSLSKLFARLTFVIKAAKNDFTSDDIGTLITTSMDGFIYMKARKVIEVWKRKPLEEISKHLNQPLLNYEKVL